MAATHSIAATNAVSPRIRGPSQLSVKPTSCRSKPTPDLRATAYTVAIINSVRSSAHPPK
jgi:hypothetical protein